MLMSEEADNVATQMTKAVVKIANSASFNKEDFLGEKLKLSQAFCLLWQNPKSGDVSGRKCSPASNAAVAAAALIDLVALDRVEIEVRPNKTLGFRNDINLLKVKKDQPTGTFLDGAIFDDRVKIYHKSQAKPEKVKDIIYGSLCQLTATNLMSTLTLNSLVDLGILDTNETCVGRSFPIVKPGLQESLKDQIRSVVLDGAEPNSYIQALLIISRLSDALNIGAPVLKKYFTKEEYGKAKKRLNTLVGIGWFGQLLEDQSNKSKYQNLIKLSIL